MKKLLFVLIICVMVFAQSIAQESKPQKDSSIETAFFGHFGFGNVFTPDFGGVSSTLTLQWINENLQGLGIEFTSGSFDSVNLDRRPDPSIITNFDPTQDEYPTSFIIDGRGKDEYTFITAFYTYGVPVGKNIHLLLQGGPSVGFIKQPTYQYRYSGSSGGFGGFGIGGGGPDIFAKGTGETNVFGGAQLRVNTLIKVSRRTVFSVGPFININSGQTVGGLQLGLMIGKGYKLRIFN